MSEWSTNSQSQGLHFVSVVAACSRTQVIGETNPDKGSALGGKQERPNPAQSVEHKIELKLTNSSISKQGKTAEVLISSFKPFCHF